MEKKKQKIANPVFTLACPDRPGVVAETAAFLAQNGCNIEHSAQQADAGASRFFMRVEYTLPDGLTNAELEAKFRAAPLGAGADAQFYDGTSSVRTVILVSKGDHCLIDLLHRTQRGELNIDPVIIISNHDTCKRVADHYTTPFKLLPVTKETRDKQEAAILDILTEQKIELVVLARYMQILSPNLCAALSGRAINIHHSFLPSFKGARPYHQAYERGVKLIGATAHFVTNDLDEGPIIEQETERVDFANDVDDFVRIGRDVERRTLAQAVRLYGQRRILMNGSKTVIFR